MNNIVVPGGRQIRENHSIPAAPRHNFGNVDITQKQKARYGYRL